MIGAWGSYFEQDNRGWSTGRRALVVGVPDSAEHSGKVNLSIFNDPGKDAGRPMQETRRGVWVAEEAPKGNTPAEPTMEGKMGIFVPDPGEAMPVSRKRGKR